MAVGDTRLTRTKYAWLKNPANFSINARWDFAALRTSTRQSARAWAPKERLRRLWEYRSVGAARTIFAAGTTGRCGRVSNRAPIPHRRAVLRPFVTP